MSPPPSSSSRLVYSSPDKCHMYTQAILLVFSVYAMVYNNNAPSHRTNTISVGVDSGGCDRRWGDLLSAVCDIVLYSLYPENNSAPFFRSVPFPCVYQTGRIKRFLPVCLWGITTAPLTTTRQTITVTFSDRTKV